MSRPFTPLQAHENRLFLDALARSGNARMAAREAGRAHNSFHHRRKTHADFAQQWAAARAAVNARLHLAGGKRGPTPPPRGARSCSGGDRPRRSSARPGDGRPAHSPSKLGEDLRTKGGEPMVVRTRDGKLQIRLAHKGKLTHEAEQAFLYALSATANVRLSAAAAGASARAFYRRRRQDPAFAREMRLALKMGWERIHAALVTATLPESHAHDGWRRGDFAPIPPMSVDQAMQLLHLHEKSVQQRWEAPHRRRRRGESDEIYSARLAAMWRCENDLEAESAALRRAARYEETGDWRLEDEPPPPELPPLELVTGWSKASGRPAHNPGLALFGGWRIGDMARKRAKR
jgi:hypothetical protein